MLVQARDISPELLAAQQHLVKLRQTHQLSHKKETAVSAKRPSSSHAPEPLCLPAHLGWHSQPFSVLQQTAVSHQVHEIEVERDGLPTRQTSQVQSVAPAPNTIQLYPDIALGMLRTESEAAGRIWLLLRHLDQSGRGWVAVSEARTRLTKKQSAIRVCGWRQLRNLLAAGEGVFWSRQNGRIWLRALPKVAVSLGVQHFSSKPIALPVSIVTQRIGTVRAHFYASFHSSRTNPKPGATQMKPIARSTIQKITHVHPRIQRLYEKTARVQPQRNFSVGTAYTPDGAQSEIWQRGSAVFKLTDKNGRFGTPGKSYLAWQLPNSYAGPHRIQTSNQQKRINRALTDLMLQGTTGNSQCTSITEPEQFVECGVRYCENGRFAAQTIQRNQVETAYWPEIKQGNARIWHSLSGIVCSRKTRPEKMIPHFRDL